MKKFVLACLAFVLAISPVQRVMALSCAQPTVPSLYKFSDKIFVGELLNGDTRTQGVAGPGNYTLSRYRVQEALKGTSVGDEVEVRFNTSWGDDAPPLHAEGSLVSAEDRDGVLVSLDCHPWSPMNDEAANQYGYASMNYLKRDIQLQVQLDADEDSKETTSKTSAQIPIRTVIAVSFLSAIVGAVLVTLARHLRPKSNKK